MRNSAGNSYLLELVEVDEVADEVPSRWSGTQTAAAELGLEIGGRVGIGDLLAADELLGPVVELQFTAPVSVSSVWGLSPDAQDAINQAHQAAVDLALAHLGLALGAVPVAAQFTHSFARLSPIESPPPQLHTHVLLIALDMDESPQESIVVGPPGALPPPHARLAFVPDDLDRVAPIAYEAYLAQLSTRLSQMGYDIDDGGEIIGVPDGLRAEFAPKPCGLGLPGRAIRLLSEG